MQNFIFRFKALAILSLFLTIPLAKAQAQETPQSKPPQIIRKSTGIFQTGAFRRVLPDYPQEAKSQGLSGEVIIEVLVGTDGSVISTKPVSGNQLLVAAAMKALKDWKFNPTLLSGTPVQIIGNAVFTFAKDGNVTEGSATYPVNRDSPGQIIRSVSVERAAPLISENERRELTQKFQNTYEIPLRITNPENVVLEITKAKVKTVNREAKDDVTNDKDPSYVADYAMQMTIDLQNKTDKVINGAGLKFTNIETRQVFFSYPNIPGIYPQKTYQVQYDLMILAGNPANLQVELVGVRFDDGKTGGSFSTHPGLGFTTPQPANSTVDSKPRPLNHLRANYSAEARKNGIRGAVRLQIKIGADGSVKNVQVLNALPDGLTEEAVRIAKVLQFQPAMSKGVPVDYTILMDVEFVLV